MESPDLIFQPLKVSCPRCGKPAKISFETVQFNDEITCDKCGNVFVLNVDPQRLLEMMKAIEARYSDKSS